MLFSSFGFCVDWLVWFCFSLPISIFYLLLCFLCLSSLPVHSKIQKEPWVDRKAGDFLNMSDNLVEMGMNLVFWKEVAVSNSNQTDCLVLLTALFMNIYLWLDTNVYLFKRLSHSSVAITLTGVRDIYIHINFRVTRSTQKSESAASLALYSVVATDT